MSTTSILDIQNLSAFYGRLKALHEVSLTVNSQEIVAIMGPNGAGKTTLIHAITNIISNQGQVWLEGRDISTTPTYQLIRQGIGVVPDGRGTLTQLSVRDNLLLAADFRRDQEVERDIEKIYGYFPIFKERSALPAGLLSGGEQEMLAIARCLMGRPKLVLLDEPSLGLAPIMIKQVFTALKHIHEQEKTSFLLVEQNIALALKNFAQRAYILESGHVVKEASSEVLLADDTVLESYLGAQTKAGDS